MQNRIKILRKQNNLTQSALAELIGTTPQQIQYLETGKRRLTDKWMHAVATAVGCETWEILISRQDVLRAESLELVARYENLPAHLRRIIDFAMEEGEKLNKNGTG